MAVEQIRSWWGQGLSQASPTSPLPVFTFDAGYDSVHLSLAYVQMRLARDTAGDVRLPWQPLLPPERRTPARVRRAFSHLLQTLCSPVNAPKPCGRSPGRPAGKRSPPAQRFPAVKLTL